MWLVVFVVCLALSGVTAFPLVHEVRWVDGWGLPGFVGDWISRVREGADATDADYPFLFYGTDWLAFAHLVIATAFYGVWRDAVRNIWIVEWAMIACAGVIPLAAICIPIRGLPLWWMPVDMAFGVFGVVPLLILRRMIKRLEAMPPAAAVSPEPLPDAGAPA